MIGKPPNDVLTLLGAISTTVRSAITYTFICTSTNTGNNGDLTLKGVCSSGTATIASGGCKIAWIKIA